MLIKDVGIALADAAVQEELEAGRLGGSGDRMSAYVQIVARPQLGGKVRDLRELETLGRCLDLLRSGKLPQLGDSLAGRFLAVENAGIHSNWSDAQHLEVIPTRQAGLAQPAVVLKAQRHQRQVEKAAGRGSWKGANRCMGARPMAPEARGECAQGRAKEKENKKDEVPRDIRRRQRGRTRKSQERVQQANELLGAWKMDGGTVREVPLAPPCSVLFLAKNSWKQVRRVLILWRVRCRTPTLHSHHCRQ